MADQPTSSATKSPGMGDSSLIQRPHERSSFIQHFEEFRGAWNRKVQELKRALRSLKGQHRSHSPDEGGQEGELDVFEVIFQLFGEHRKALAAIQVLEDAFSVYPTDVETFIPQLTVCLLFGAPEISRVLQLSVLRICGRSATFAHRLHFFISSFALHGAGIDDAGITSLNCLLTDIAREGETASTLLATTGVNTPSIHHGSVNGREGMSSSGKKIDDIGLVVPDRKSTGKSSVLTVSGGPEWTSQWVVPRPVSPIPTSVGLDLEDGWNGVRKGSDTTSIVAMTPTKDIPIRTNNGIDTSSSPPPSTPPNHISTTVATITTPTSATASGRRYVMPTKTVNKFVSVDHQYLWSIHEGKEDGDNHETNEGNGDKARAAPCLTGNDPPNTFSRRKFPFVFVLYFLADMT